VIVVVTYFRNTLMLLSASDTLKFPFALTVPDGTVSSAQAFMSQMPGGGVYGGLDPGGVIPGGDCPLNGGLLVLVPQNSTS
jgi:hypothetical protein